MSKSPDAFRTISEVAEWLDTPTYVLRFWESRFSQIKPVKRAGGRRYYRPDDMLLLGGIKKLLHFDDQSIKQVKQLLKDKGVKHVMSLSPDLNTQVVSPPSKADAADTADIERIVRATPAAKKKPAVEVRVVKKGKVAQGHADDNTVDAKNVDETTPKEASEEKSVSTAQAQGAAASEAAEPVDQINNTPYLIKQASAYDTKTIEEIEKLYYALRMTRNSMRRALEPSETHAE